MLTIAFLLSLCLIGGSVVLYSLRYGISPMPSSRKAKEAVLSIIPKDIHGKIVELGSGWGTLAFPLAAQFPECEVDAYEISPIPWGVSRLIQLIKRRKNLRLLRQDFYHVPLKDAALVVCYLYPGAMRKLKDKFESELQAGTFVISHTFAVPGWTPLMVWRLDDMYFTPIYLYKL